MSDSGIDVTLAARCLARDRADWLLAEARWWANEMREIACNAADDDIARADANCVATYEVSRSDVRLQPARPPWERHDD